MTSSKSRYQDILSQCRATGKLYEDSEFPASAKSVYFSKVDPNIKWRRPTELLAKPKFILDTASRFDLDQGALGDCWFIAAAATLATRPELFSNVVLPDQSFDKDYTGAFRFRFWQFGQWVEVIVDDRLPTYKAKRLMFCCNREHPDEFWPSLLEKAYAKLAGSYEALDGGCTEDALVDFTGGIGHRIDLTKKSELPPDFYHVMVKHDKMSTLMGCSILSSKETMEDELSNGLIIGHAYSITKVIEIQSQGKSYQLLRLRNPWGKKEWSGPWGDKSKEWLRLDPKERENLGVVNQEDGEFWMAYDDWIANFQAMQLCHLPEGKTISGRKEWKGINFSGSWVRGVSAGGSAGTFNANSYWINPQYCVSMVATEGSLRSKTKDKQSPKTSTLIVSLMQKNTKLNRTKYHLDNADVPISFDIYKAKTDKLPNTLSETHFDTHALKVANLGSQYTNYREIANHYQMEPGIYVIVPSTYEPNTPGDFLLRVFTEQEADGSEMDVPTARVLKSTPTGDSLDTLYARYAGSDGVIDARELQSLLNEAFVKVLGKDHNFDLETCRSLLSMLDRDQSGLLELGEFRTLWSELNTWRDVYQQFDKDSSGFIDATELQSIFKSVGYTLSRPVLKTLVRRYGGKECKLYFNEFVLATTKVVSLIEIFPSLSKDGLKGKAELSLDEVMMFTITSEYSVQDLRSDICAYNFTRGHPRICSER